MINPSRLPVPNITPAECILVLYAPPSHQRTADAVIPSVALDAGCGDSLSHCVPKAYYIATFGRHGFQERQDALFSPEVLGLLLSSADWAMVRRRCWC